ncbi:hypothetical protein [Streptomyces sp. NBC_00893]|uniref:DUF7878 domain-containing protein n=1 Tax=Streptomyces sp. NBC_00893 TaxID=2975862 RepID=UPI0022539781|nr:hypothetical protein [Streptomyces sp. NBC_00893]MCX4852079.1 hypothetical protein [Streptomyces sp. NBC_00893]
MKIHYENLSVDSPSGPTLAETLLSIEADLTITDRGQEIFSESSFPVAELAYSLCKWVSEADENEGFSFDSMSADPGLVNIARRENGWSVTSTLAPGASTCPIGREILEREIRRFMVNVRRDISHLGVDPYFLLEGI